MKKYILKSVSLFALFAVLASCNDDDVVYNGAQSLVGYNQTEVNLPVYAADVTTATNKIFLEVGSTKSVNYDRTFTISLNTDFTTAVASSYTVQQTNLIIPAGQFVGTIEINGNYSELPVDFSEKIIVLDLEEVQDADLYNEEKVRAVVNIYRSCFQEPAENYTGAITSTSGSNTLPYEVTLVEYPDADNTWTVENIWGDLVNGATGSTSYTGQFKYPARIRIKCDNTVAITGTGSYGDGGTGAYNANTKVITGTISHKNIFTNDFPVSFRLTPSN